jgi:hypothetical protein
MRIRRGKIASLAILAFLAACLSTTAQDNAAQAAVTADATASAPSAPSSAITPTEAKAKKGIFAYLAAPRALRPGLGAVLIVNLDPDAGTKYVNPSVADSVSFGLEYPIGPADSPFSLEPSCLVYWAYYELTNSGRAVPSPMEFRNAAVVGLILDWSASYTLPISRRSSFAAGLGLAFDIRAGLRADPDTSGTPDGTIAAINNYLWSGGRFFMPSALVRYEYKAKESIGMEASLKAYLPIYNLWTGEDLGFFDGALIQPALMVRIALKR